MVEVTAFSYGRKCNIPCVTSQVDICPIPFHYDTYVGCSHGCLYCFARDNVNFRRRKSGLQFKQLEFNSVKNFQHQINKLLVKKNSTIGEFLRRRVPLKIGANADPFPEIEKKNRITYHTLKVLEQLDYPVQVQTKRPDIFMAYAHDFIDYNNLIISVTCVTNDELSTKIEPGVPTTSERFRSMAELPFPVMTKCQPSIYPIILDDLPFLVESAKDAGCWAFLTEGLKLRFASGSKEREYYLKLGRILGIDNLYEYYKQEITTSTDYELSTPKKLEYTRLARLLSHKHGLKYFSSDNQAECIKLSDSDECCGTEKLRNYTKFSYNFRTKTFTGKKWADLENGLEKLEYAGRNIKEETCLRDIVHKKIL